LTAFSEVSFKTNPNVARVLKKTLSVVFKIENRGCSKARLMTSVFGTAALDLSGESGLLTAFPQAFPKTNPNVVRRMQFAFWEKLTITMNINGRHCRTIRLKEAGGTDHQSIGAAQE
jgi:hypothetical protein